jgi:hypothetical protein
MVMIMPDAYCGSQASSSVPARTPAVGTQSGFALGGFAPSIAAVLVGPGLANPVDGQQPQATSPMPTAIAAAASHPAANDGHVRRRRVRGRGLAGWA